MVFFIDNKPELPKQGFDNLAFKDKGEPQKKEERRNQEKPKTVEETNACEHRDQRDQNQEANGTGSIWFFDLYAVRLDDLKFVLLRIFPWQNLYESDISRVSILPFPSSRCCCTVIALLPLSTPFRAGIL